MLKRLLSDCPYVGHTLVNYFGMQWNNTYRYANISWIILWTTNFNDQIPQPYHKVCTILNQSFNMHSVVFCWWTWMLYKGSSCRFIQHFVNALYKTNICFIIYLLYTVISPVYFCWYVKILSHLTHLFVYHFIVTLTVIFVVRSHKYVLNIKAVTISITCM